VSAPRIVSLVPSITETLLAWGIEPVAVTRFCEQPTLRAVGGTKDPDIDAIVALRPDLVVVDEEENRRADADALVAAGIALHVTAVRSVAAVAPMLEDLAAACSHHGSLSGPIGSDRGFDSASVRRAAFVPIWRRPWMTINDDTYGASILAAIGITNIFGDAAERYPTVTLDDVAAKRLDVVLLPSEPYPFAPRHVADVASLAPEVQLVDGRDLFWWGARTAAAIARLGQLLGS
jgi:ABC-type Fe3+-hydroxamate transport system substrate-binding protein